MVCLCLVWVMLLGLFVDGVCCGFVLNSSCFWFWIIVLFDLFRCFVC